MHEKIAAWEWLTTREGEEAIRCAPINPTASAITNLRKRYSPEQVASIIELGRARVKAAGKLDPRWAQTIMADTAGVEMASSSLASAYKARRFASAFDQGSLIADLCCGIGGDSWGLQSAGLMPIGVDSDPLRSWMYGQNFGHARAVCGDALIDLPTEAGAFHLDPARRDGTGRIRSAADFQPGPAVWEQLLRRIESGGIKLNPGIDPYSLPEGEFEVISENGSLTQGVLWTGKLAGSLTRRASWIHPNGRVVSLTGMPGRPDDSTPIGSYIGTVDPAPERADLIEVLLGLTGSGLVHPGTGLVTGERPVWHEMVRWYRVLEVMPWSLKRARKMLRSYGNGVVEVRTRDGVVNTDQLQRALRGDGDRDDLSILVYRLGRRVICVLAEPAVCLECGELVPSDNSVDPSCTSKNGAGR